MNRITTRFIVWLSILTIALACKHEDEPDPQPVMQAKLSIVKGDRQTGFFGEYLPDSLVLKVTPTGTIPAGNFRVSYQITQGNGYMEPINNGIVYSNTYLQSDSKGMLKLRWNLGCNALQQKVVFYLYSNDCPAVDLQNNKCLPIDSVSFAAAAKQPSGWSRACGVGSSFSFQPSFASHQNRIYFVNGGVAYSSTDGGINWNAFPASTPQDIRFLKCNSQGYLYALTENKGVFYSRDQGVSWTEINTGILDHRYPLALVVEDDNLFVSFYFDGLYRSKNNGAFWKKLLIEGKYHEEYQYITRVPNGDLFLFDKWSTLFKSSNNGDKWQRQSLNYRYSSGTKGEMAIDHAGHLVIGDEYNGYLAVLSPATLTGEVVSFYTPETHSTCTVRQITPYQDKLYFAVTGNLKPGVYFGNQGNYTYAHPGLETRVEAFHVKNDGSLLLVNSSGLYYEAK
jgi:photosystem II stability/assembly factor-like uncharacterized protein